jgi:redox-sensitive bicupin YhaK (pirin superfamily)
VQHWDLRALDVQPHQPQVLHSQGEGRTIVLTLPKGEMLQEHETHERAWVLVVDGEVEIAGEDTIRGGSGVLAIFDPHERREVRATTDARLLLMLGPWPGAGRDLDRDA